MNRYFETKNIIRLEFYDERNHIIQKDIHCIASIRIGTTNVVSIKIVRKYLLNGAAC